MPDLSQMFPNATASTRAKNPALFGLALAPFGPAPLFLPVAASAIVPEKRIRQKNGPKLNKTESAFMDHLRFYFEPKYIYAQAITLQLANGLRYTPDFVVMGHGAKSDLPPHCFEVKGPHAWEDSLVKLKVAARTYPFFKFTLAWRKGRAEPWQTQDVKP